MRRHRNSRCCKICLVLILSMTLTQIFFFYTGSSMTTFNYKGTMPMAIFFESLGYDYAGVDYQEEEKTPEDYEYLLDDGGDLQEEEFLTDESDQDLAYEEIIQEASDELGEAIPELRDDHLDTDSEASPEANAEIGLDQPEEPPKQIMFVPRDHPIPTAPVAPHAIPPQPNESNLISLVYNPAVKKPEDNKVHADVPIPEVPDVPVQNYPTLEIGPPPPAQQPQQQQLFPGMQNLAEQKNEGMLPLGQVQNAQSLPAAPQPSAPQAAAPQPAAPTGSQPEQDAADAILQNFLKAFQQKQQQSNLQATQLSDEQLLRLLTRPPEGKTGSKDETQLLDVLENYEKEIQKKEEPTVVQPTPNQKPTVIDLEPDIPWTSTNGEKPAEAPQGAQSESADSAFKAKALAALIENKDNPTEQTKILKDLMQWQMSRNQNAPEAIQTAVQGSQTEIQSSVPEDRSGELQESDYVSEDMMLEEAQQQEQRPPSMTVGSEFLYGYFPDGFMWSVATAAFQVEGGWNEGGKGKSIWDVFTHEGNVEDGSNAHVACDSYHRYIDDVMMLKQLGVKNYRFSISWTRIQPTGTELVPNKYGINYYNKLIDALLEANIQPVVTLYHWDLPQALQDQGGWLNQTLMIKSFSYFAKICFTEFGDRVKFWVTINEPSMVAWIGYGRGKKAPGVHGESDLVYIAGHNIISAHATVYRLYQKYFQSKQKGFVGISLNIVWKEPKTDSPVDVAATDRAMQFDLGWFANPIYGNGDYPEVMKKQVARKSMENGLPRSRLPGFTPDEIKRNKGTSDFFGLNTYTSRLVEHFPQPNRKPTYFKDQDVKYSMDPTWEIGDRGRAIYPQGLRKLLNWIQKSYGPRPIYITENGIADDIGVLNDTHRINYIKSYTDEVLKAVTIDGVRVIGYTVWSLMDNFEWEKGYQEKLGLYHVDFRDPDRRRTPKESAKFYAQLIADNGYPPPSF